jgi:hypothetical protein
MLDTGQELTVAPNPLFPIQPDPPTITGDAPTATLTMAYSFAYTATPGDAPIASVVLRSGELPPGLSMDNAGVITGTPTTIGSYPYTVRVTDTNGLYDDHDDTIAVSLDGAISIPTIQVLVNGTGGGGASNFISVHDSNEFSAIGVITGNPWVRWVCRTSSSTDGIPPNARMYVWDQTNQAGDIVFDSGWFGDPADKAATDALLPSYDSALSPLIWQDVVGDVFPVAAVPEFSILIRNFYTEAFVLPSDAPLYSGKNVVYRRTSELNNYLLVEYPDPAQIPVGAVKLDAYPGYYTASGQLYVCDWEAT